jgi:hypothetical protein
MTSSELVVRLRELVQDGTTVGASDRSTPPVGSLDDALRQIENLEIALERRTVTGQATGLVMERFGLSADVAFGVLRRLSQERNRKVYDIARELVSEGSSEGL